MALSYSWVQTRDDIINRALRLIGVLGIGETAEAQAVTNAAQALNALLKQWSGQHSAPWRTAPIFLQTVISQQHVDITTVQSNDGVIGVLMASVAQLASRDDVTELEIITQKDWLPISHIDSIEGKPEMLHPGILGTKGYIGKLFLHPIPDKVYYLDIEVLMALKDFGASSDEMQMAAPWANALTFGLAADLSHEYSCPMNERQALRGEASAKLRDAKLSTSQMPTALIRRGYY